MKNAKTQWLLAGGAVVVAVAAMGSLYAFTPRKAPASQRAFSTLETKNIEELRTAFNAAADRPRVIAFLSPT